MNKKQGIKYLISMADGSEIFRIYGTEGSNVYVIHRNNELLIIDPGFEEDVNHVRNEIEFQFKNEKKIKGIFLTHYHKDHCGGAGKLAEILDCPIYLSEIDNRVFLSEEEYIPLPREINEGTRKFLENSSLFERCFSKDKTWYPKVSETIKDNDEIMGFKCLIKPGHTEGLCCLYNGIDGILFSGDYLVYPKGIFPGFFKKFVRSVNMDMEKSLISTKELLKLNFNTLLPSHGEQLINNGKMIVSKSQLYSDLL